MDTRYIYLPIGDTQFLYVVEAGACAVCKISMSQRDADEGQLLIIFSPKQNFAAHLDHFYLIEPTGGALRSTTDHEANLERALAAFDGIAPY